MLTAVNSAGRRCVLGPVTWRGCAGLVSQPQLSLASANLIANEAVATAKRHCFNPVTVTVVDPSGQVLATQRMDGCPSGALPKYAYAKACTAVSMGMSSRAMREKYTPSGMKPQDFSKLAQLSSMVEITGGLIAPFPGGVVLRNKEGIIVGGVGISGASADEDEYCALCGAEALGGLVQTDPATHSCSTLKK
ncbi:hypothetical protein B484DRAFT_449563 [Ochromonadaceae sp. CCMP2298]|nr:hypothetical protein B484DRAFT_449563 [Ochromonadaceae sp. CCMP2298]